MMAVRGLVTREGEVVHLVTQRVSDLPAELASVGEREADFPLPHGRGDQIRRSGSDPELRSVPHKPFCARDLYDPHRHISDIRVKTRDFR
jgi:error-prone DNA polymerase